MSNLKKLHRNLDGAEALANGLVSPILEAHAEAAALRDSANEIEGHARQTTKSIGDTIQRLLGGKP